MLDCADAATLQCWLTIKEAGRAYGVSVQQIRHRLLEGQVPAGRLPTASGWVWRNAPPAGAASADPTTLVALHLEVARLRVALRECEEARRPVPEEAARYARP